MTNVYKAWGIAIASSFEFDWPQIATTPRLHFQYGDVPTTLPVIHRATDTDRVGQLVIAASQGVVTWNWREHSAAIQGQHLTYNGAADPTTYLERVVLPTWLMLSDPHPVGFHAAAVQSLRGDIFVLIGPSGVGKSSSALELQRFDFAVLCDDVAIVDENQVVQAPSARVRGASAHEEDFAGSGKRRLRLPDAPEPGRLAAFVALSRGAPSWGRLEGTHAFQALAGARFDFTDWDPTTRRTQFEHVAELARSVPVYAFTFASDSSNRPSHAAALAQVLLESVS
ncbi:MAG: hypothetical protein R3E66_07855 [bacterium]